MRIRVSLVPLAVLGVVLASAAALPAQTSNAASPAQTSTTAEFARGAVIRVDGVPHSFHYFVPEREENAPPMALLVLMHGAGGDGMGQIRAWLPVARANKCILLAPDLDNSPQAWDALYAHPEWIRAAIDTLGQSYPVDQHRLYLWGYSAGGMFTFYFAFIESRYFAAAAVHGGVIENFKYRMADLTVRKIPSAYYIGTRDQWWTTRQARASRDALLLRGFAVHYVELKDADHNFFARSDEITADVWEFLRQYRLDGEARFDPLDREKIKKALR